MSRSAPFWAVVVMMLVAMGNELHAQAQAPAAGPPLTVEEVLKLSKTKVPEDLIITMIKKNGKAFNLVPEEVEELRKSGVSDNVVKFLIDPTQPYTPPPAPAPPPTPVPGPVTPPKQYPADPYAIRIPADSGLYQITEGGPLKTDIKLLLGTTEGAGIGKVLLKKATAFVYLLGSMSKTRVKEATPVFYLRLPDGKTVEEVLLLALEQEKDRRKIEVGPTLEKQQLKPEAMRPFDSVEVGPRLFKLTTSKLTKGEYIFFLLGSAEPPKGVYGKGYDFGMEVSK